MAQVNDYKGSINCWGKEREVLRVRWDFDKDGGAVGALDLFTAAEKMIVESAKMVAKAAVTTSASGTISCGKSGDVAGLIAATGASDLEIDEVKFGAAQDASHVLAADDVVVMDIATGALTAGVVDFLFELQKA